MATQQGTVTGYSFSFCFGFQQPLEYHYYFSIVHRVVWPWPVFDWALKGVNSFSCTSKDTDSTSSRRVEGYHHEFEGLQILAIGNQIPNTTTKLGFGEEKGQSNTTR